MIADLQLIIYNLLLIITCTGDKTSRVNSPRELIEPDHYEMYSMPLSVVKSLECQYHFRKYINMEFRKVLDHNTAF